VRQDTELRDICLFKDIWDDIKCPVYVMRGKESDLLLPETVEQMRSRGPGITDLLELEGIGHAPSLLFEDQAKAISGWLFSS
jgi:pimeloyl-ACP methyl ester carboxylesterase